MIWISKDITTNTNSYLLITGGKSLLATTSQNEGVGGDCWGNFALRRRGEVDMNIGHFIWGTFYLAIYGYLGI